MPLTSNTARVLPFQVLVPAEQSGLEVDSKAQAEQVRSISIVRVIRPIGWVPTELMGAIGEALRTHLSLYGRQRDRLRSRSHSEVSDAREGHGREGSRGVRQHRAASR